MLYGLAQASNIYYQEPSILCYSSQNSIVFQLIFPPFKRLALSHLVKPPCGGPPRVGQVGQAVDCKYISIIIQSGPQQYNASIKSFYRHIRFLSVYSSTVLAASLSTGISVWSLIGLGNSIVLTAGSYFRGLSFFQLGKPKEQSSTQLYSVGISVQSLSSS